MPKHKTNFFPYYVENYLKFRHDLQSNKMSTEVGNRYFEKFKQGLAELGFTYEYIVANYKYCGGNGGIKGSINRHVNYYKTIMNDKPFPEREKKCLCGHDIIENCYIYNPSDLNEPLIVVGNCCINRFLSKSAGRQCKICGVAHKSRKHNLCSNCKTKYCNNCDTTKKSLIFKSKRCKECFNKFLQETDPEQYKKIMKKEEMDRIEAERQKREKEEKERADAERAATIKTIWRNGNVKAKLETYTNISKLLILAERKNLENYYNMSREEIIDALVPITIHADLPIR